MKNIYTKDVNLVYRVGSVQIYTNRNLERLVYCQYG